MSSIESSTTSAATISTTSTTTTTTTNTTTTTTSITGSITATNSTNNVAHEYSLSTITKQPVSFDFQNKLFLAPMVRCGSLPMRLMALKYGADCVYTPELIAFKLRNCKRVVNEVLGTIDFVHKSELVLRTNSFDNPCIVQIGAATADVAVAAARVVANDFYGIDLNMGCFPEEDHQILTNRGYRFLHEIESIVERDASGNVTNWNGLRVASFDAQRKTLCYREPRALVVNRAPARVVEFENVAAVGDDASVPTVVVSVVATHNHEMFVATTAGADFAKLHAEKLASMPTREFRFLAAALGGIEHDHESQIEIDSNQLEMYGMWLGKRVMSATMTPTGLWHGERCIASWVEQLDGAALRCIVAGLCRSLADASTVVVPSVDWRDELMLLLMHAGYAATFERVGGERGDVWRVKFTDDAAAVEPCVQLASRSAPSSSSPTLAAATTCRFSVGRTWCFDLRSSEYTNDGFVVVRRAQREFCLKTNRSIIVKASLATIQGNCPKNFSTHGGMGAALLRTPDVACDILSSLIREFPHVVVTCKIRLLENAEATAELMRRLVATGVKAIAVHAREKHERPTDRAHWDALRAVIDLGNFPIPIMANGDVFVPDDIARARAATGCQSLLIARGALDNVSIFSGTLQPCSVLWREYLRMAITWDMPMSNVKFTLLRMMTAIAKSRHSLYQSVASSKTMRDLCVVFDLVAEHNQIEARIDARRQELIRQAQARGDTAALEALGARFVEGEDPSAAAATPSSSSNSSKRPATDDNAEEPLAKITKKQE